MPNLLYNMSTRKRNYKKTRRGSVSDSKQEESIGEGSILGELQIAMKEEGGAGEEQNELLEQINDAVNSIE